MEYDQKQQMSLLDQETLEAGGPSPLSSFCRIDADEHSIRGRVQKVEEA